MNDIFRTGWVSGVLVWTSLLLLLLAGCAGKTPDTLSARQMEAIGHNQRGIKAEARGENLKALEEFSEALRISTSIENSEGIVVSLINSSRVHRHNGDVKAASVMISGAIFRVTPLSPLYPEVAFEMAQVKLLSGELNEAFEWASHAVTAGKDSSRGMMINLLARILYLRGNPIEAEVKAQEALLLSRESGVRGEEANALRTLGDIQAADKRRAEASDSYHAALVIDKAMGMSRKIAADLRSLALLSLSQENSDQALGFYQRAFSVSSSGGDRSGAADDLLRMSHIHEKRGEKELAERMLAERATLLRNISTP